MSRYIDINTFKNTLTVLNDSIAWDIAGNRDPYKCIGIDPFSIFELEPVKDPLEKTKMNHSEFSGKSANR